MTGEERIDRLITRFVSGEALPDEAMELDDWIKESPVNREIFDEYSRILELADSSTPTEKAQPVKTIHWRWIGIAASLILIAAAWWLIQKGEGGEIVHTANAIAQKIVLRDSSQIIVAAHSFISVSKEYGVRNRKIKLRGSATFSVIHNPSMELIVDVNAFHIKDIGTKFSVAAPPQSDTVTIVVAEGKIAVYDDFGSEAKAAAGERVVYTRSNRKIILFPEKPEKAEEPAKQDTVITSLAPTEKPVEPKRPTAQNPTPTKKPVQNPAPIKKPAPIQEPTVKKQVMTPDSTKRLFLTPVPDLLKIEPDTQPDDDLARRDSTPSQRIVTDLVNDHLIQRGYPLKFTLSDTAFILNGRRLPRDVHIRYRQKYGGPRLTTPWSWTHGENNGLKQ